LFSCRTFMVTPAVSSSPLHRLWKGNICLASTLSSFLNINILTPTLPFINATYPAIVISRYIHLPHASCRRCCWVPAAADGPQPPPMHSAGLGRQQWRHLVATLTTTRCFPRHCNVTHSFHPQTGLTTHQLYCFRQVGTRPSQIITDCQKNEAFLLVKCIWRYVYIWANDHFGLVWRKLIHLRQRYAQKTIFTFSFPMNLTFRA